VPRLTRHRKSYTQLSNCHVPSSIVHTSEQKCSPTAHPRQLETATLQRMDRMSDNSIPRVGAHATIDRWPTCSEKNAQFDTHMQCLLKTSNHTLVRLCHGSMRSHTPSASQSRLGLRTLLDASNYVSSLRKAPSAHRAQRTAMRSPRERERACVLNHASGCKKRMLRTSPHDRRSS